MLSRDQGATAYGIENLAALEFVNGELTHSITCGGKAYIINNDGNRLIKHVIE
jgi:hypothetical protein